MGLLGWAWTWLSVPSRQGNLGKGPPLGSLPWGWLAYCLPEAGGGRA